jgi:hypothetical protein
VLSCRLSNRHPDEFSVSRHSVAGRRSHANGGGGTGIMSSLRRFPQFGENMVWPLKLQAEDYFWAVYEKPAIVEEMPWDC